MAFTKQPQQQPQYVTQNDLTKIVYAGLAVWAFYPFIALAGLGVAFLIIGILHGGYELMTSLPDIWIALITDLELNLIVGGMIVISALFMRFVAIWHKRRCEKYQYGS